MKEVIQLLPDHLANQIAAGEVIQRPASAVKELLENALDAGATEIQLFVKDAGKELIQVIDNGCGMNPLDARMSFERHATSKIKSIADLFSIKTMGFRGEALASIAAVAQVELKTRPADQELGTLLQIEAGETKKQEPVACPSGTNFSIRNLFYNVPARRKFLKSNTSEYKHILDEFTHVAMAFPEVCFKLYHNQTEQFFLKQGSLKSRIIDLLGVRAEKKLIPVSENMELLNIEGFIGSPAAATKTRGGQFFFVNNRFIRSPYLNHAVVSAFEGLIEKDAYPFYVLRLTVDPDRVDVNVHPSKQEVKFDDEQMLYAYMQAAVRHALAQYNIAPSIDFTLNSEIQNSDAVRLPFSAEKQAATQNGFLAYSFSEKGRAHFADTSREKADWERQKGIFFQDGAKTRYSGFKIEQEENNDAESEENFTPQPFGGQQESSDKNVIEWGVYLATTVKSGFLLIHKRRARERIIYERLQNRVTSQNPFSQQLLFPFELEELPGDQPLIEEAVPVLRKMGFEITMESNKKLLVSALPAELSEGAGKSILEDLISQITLSPDMLNDPLRQGLLRRMARGIAQSDPDGLKDNAALIDELFACREPQFSPSGKRIFTILTQGMLDSHL